MRMSCNGCRVLRKGCSERCSIKPCLQWMKTPQAQANATVFLAKFYGRAGLLNLINAGPHHLRPAIFRSLLYEACGRIVNPVYGSIGLLCSENWQLCQAAVDAVLRGAPIEQVAADSSTMMSPPLKACNIHHVAKDERSAALARDLHKVKARGQFKRSEVELKLKLRVGSLEVNEAARVMWSWSHKEEAMGSSSHESGVSQHVEPPSQGEIGTDGESAFVGTVEESLAKLNEPADESHVDLELTLGFESFLK